ncbi:MAG: hypothetical protein FJZ00_02085, partial [Candidatus Sericytochromatia bacterium]|nr:hypothetical protein [Candidatus Tanganyikabacteria bacterium]
MFNSVKLREPQAVAHDAAGTLYIADTDNHRIVKMPLSGQVSSFVGSGAC